MSTTGPGLHLNLNVRGMGPSATVAINDRSNALRREGREIIKLGLGQSPFPVPDLVVDELRAHAAEKDYLPTQGLAALREAVAAYTCRHENISPSADDVLIGPGSKELMFLIQLVFYGDLVIPTPAWVSYAPQARIIGRQVRLIQTKAEDGYRIDPEEFTRFCQEDPQRPRLLILNYPSNPTGATYSAEQLAALAEVARREKVLVLSDEIYGALHFRGEHVSIARYYPEGTIISSGLSKWCGAGGWRIGTFVFPKELGWLREAMIAAASETYTSVSAPIQYASVAAFGEHAELDAYLARSRKILASLGGWVHRTLTSTGTTCPRPEGGFYLLPNFEAHRAKLAARGITGSLAFCEAVLEETGVAFQPGSAFGRPADELTARLAYVDFDGAEALAHVDGELDDAWLEAHCPRVVRGIRLLNEFLAS